MYEHLKRKTNITKKKDQLKRDKKLFTFFFYLRAFTETKARGTVG